MPESEKVDHPSNGQPNSSKENDVRNIESEKQKRDGGNGSDEKPKNQNEPLKKPSKVASFKAKLTEKQDKFRVKTNPPGGHDNTAVPSAPDGYTIKFTFHRAYNLPVSDFAMRTSDPYILATLTSPLPKRHKEDPDLAFRTRTIHKETNPEWNTEWIVAGVPSSGFRLKCRLYDEDPSDYDDRLGNVTIHVNSVGPGWEGIQNGKYLIKKRMASKRAYFVRGCVALLSSVKMAGDLYVSAEMVGESDKPHGRMYTVGKTAWIKHYSPMIGRIAGTKAPDGKAAHNEDQKKNERYDFQANQFQLEGPVPPELYHRFVEFKPFVAGMFWSTGIRGRILNRVLHHQHASVYNFSGKTKHGIVPPKSHEASSQFLKMVHYDEGGRIFTYVLTLDGMLRFTETGKEFGIDLLSKHTMHSDVNFYIACSGEFFVRRFARPDKLTDESQQKTHPGDDIPGKPPRSKPPPAPEDYELVIDNDSGTYRPNGDLLHFLKDFLAANFPGLHIVTKECADDELKKLKDGQREKKKREGKQMTVVQGDRHRRGRHDDDDDLGSISSSDEEELDRRIGGNEAKSRLVRAYEALEDPMAGIQELRDRIPGQRSRSTKNEREITEQEGDTHKQKGDT